MTVLEAHVPKERLQDVEKVFREGTKDIPPSIVETFLVQDTAIPTLYRLKTAKPTLSIFNIIVRSAH